MREFKFATADVIADPYPMFEAARHFSPVQMKHDGRGELWSVLTYEHVHEVLRDHQRFSSAGFGDFGSDLFRLVLINDDPPKHTRLRRAVTQSFTRAAIEAITPWIDATVETLLDDVADQSIDFMPVLAERLPLQTILSLLGVADEEVRFKTWTANLMEVRGRAAEARTEGIVDMVAYLDKLIAQRRSEPLDSLLRPLLMPQADDQDFTEAELLGFFILLLVAGTGSTAYLIGNAINILAENEPLWRQLQADPESVNPFIEEVLRFESPVQLLPRRALVDVELSGTVIPKGAVIFVQYGSANRDPAAFDNPDQFRLDRDSNRHLAFGAGIHRCLGSPLARREVESVLNAMLRRYDMIEPAGPSVRQGTAAGFYGFESLPVRLIGPRQDRRRGSTIGN